MTLANNLLNTRNRKAAWYERITSLPLNNEEREVVDQLFSRHTPTFAQAYTLTEIERQYDPRHAVA